jgi:hypothetical protein
MSVCSTHRAEVSANRSFLNYMLVNDFITSIGQLLHFRWRTKHNEALDNRSTPWLAEHEGSEQLYDEMTKTPHEAMST